MSLPCHKTTDGIVTTCWKASIKERIQILIFGKIYLKILTFNKPLQPLKMNLKKVILKDDDESN